MARKLRLQYEGAIYHVMSRGDHREDIFRDDHDREIFLKTIGEASAKTGWQVHAWCLMRNHFHLVIETPNANLVAGMKWLLGTYTGRFNRRHKLNGHLFSGRYKALFVDGSGNGYLKSVCDYLHLNPVRAKLLDPRQKLSAFAWSSYPEYLKTPHERRGWLRVDRVFGEHGIPKDSRAGRREFENRLEMRRKSEDGTESKTIVTNWFLGSDEFRKELLAQMGEAAGREHFGSEIRESEEDRADRILRQELNKIDCKEAALKEMPKGDPRKIKIARRLRCETTVTMAWIASRLQMGARTHASHLLYWHGKSKSKKRRSDNTKN